LWKKSKSICFFINKENAEEIRTKTEHSKMKREKKAARICIDRAADEFVSIV